MIMKRVTKEATTESNVFYLMNKNERHRIQKNAIHEKYTEIAIERKKHASDDVDLHDQWNRSSVNQVAWPECGAEDWRS